MDAAVSFSLALTCCKRPDCQTLSACRLDIDVGWAEATQLELTGTLNMHWQHCLQRQGLGLPVMQEEEWERIAKDSLPAALQRLIWPASQAYRATTQVRQAFMLSNCTPLHLRPPLVVILSSVQHLAVASSNHAASRHVQLPGKISVSLLRTVDSVHLMT